jgi:hypothetical protein
VEIALKINRKAPKKSAVLPNFCAAQKPCIDCDFGYQILAVKTLVTPRSFFASS